MPLLTWQVQVDTLVTGTSTNYTLDGDGNGIAGLGVPAPKTADVELFHSDGSYGSADYMGVRVISIPYALEGTAAQAFEWLDDLVAAFAPRTADVDLTIGLPYYGDVVYSGRPRGLDADLKEATFGRILCIGTFVALDPNAA